VLDPRAAILLAANDTLSPSSRLPVLLSLLLVPVMVIAGGCMFFLPFIRIGHVMQAGGSRHPM
jgi:hypothetical protein